MNKYLVSAVIVLLLTQLVKLGDFLLLQSQKDQIQKSMESIANRLNAVRPFRVVLFLKSRFGTILLSLGLIAGIIFWLWTQWRGPYVSQVRETQWNVRSIAFSAYVLLFLVFTSYLSLKDLFQLWRRHINSLLAEERFSGFVQYFWKLFFKFAAGVGGTLLGIWLMVYTSRMYLRIILFILLFVPAVFMMRLFAPVVSGAVALLVWAAARIAFIVVQIMRWFIHRIVVYQKGAWQAIVLLLTLALGLWAGYLQLFRR
jgi:hypothetical protein